MQLAEGRLLLVSVELYQLVIKANQTENSERRMLKLKKLLHELPEINFETFRFLARHLAVVASKEDINKVCDVKISECCLLSLPNHNSVTAIIGRSVSQCALYLV